MKKKELEPKSFIENLATNPRTSTKVLLRLLDWDDDKIVQLAKENIQQRKTNGKKRNR